MAVRARAWRPPRGSVGAAAGAATVLLFAVVHDLFIADIWFNIGPMLVFGAVCGLCLVWSYNAAVTAHTTPRWLEYVGWCTGLLVALAGMSLLVLDPRFTMAQMMSADDALAQLLPPALPLMAAAVVVDTIVLWWRTGRNRAAWLPILVTQALLVFFVGHNLAILGLVELTSDLWRALAEFVGLTLFLGGGFAVAVPIVGWACPTRKKRLGGKPAGPGNDPRAGQVLEIGAVTLQFVKTRHETEGAIHEMRATYAAGSPLPPAHLHPNPDRDVPRRGGGAAVRRRGSRTGRGDRRFDRRRARSSPHCSQRAR